LFGRQFICRPIFLLAQLLLVSCSSLQSPDQAQASPQVSATYDACAAENLPSEVAALNNFMRVFDDYSTLASNTAQSQLIEVIPPMQAIRRQAQDYSAPVCLQNLRQVLILHMEATIDTLLAFQASAAPEILNAGINQARVYRLQYDQEIARLLGVTLVAPATVISSTNVETPEVEVDTAITSAFVTNPGPTAVNMRAAPDINADGVGSLGLNIPAPALGQTADGQWILIEVPDQAGQTAWVFAELVDLSVPAANLPVVTPSQ
jgi:hypothetical protein